MKDKDMARIFENAFPNTVDTTVRWHVDGTAKRQQQTFMNWRDQTRWQGPQSFIVTGDIDAEWLRDSTNQLRQYQPLAKKDKKIFNLILGAINTQAEFVIESPYCNAFQPPPPSGFSPVNNNQDDEVHPVPEPSFVFECKYELDSLASFLALSNQFYTQTGSTAFLTLRWHKALEILLRTLDEQEMPTFDAKIGSLNRNKYTFKRKTQAGTETLTLNGNGNPLNSGTGLVRSAFRPSDDATILGFFIPANAMIAAELKKTASMLRKNGDGMRSDRLQARGERIEAGIWEHGVVTHKKYGEVFAYEVDGYGSQIIMDDANLPSLLALPLLGFVDKEDKVYQNTRKMILDKSGNPYYLKGREFHGIGGPHIGLQNAWPMSLLVQVMTSDDDQEIVEAMELIKEASPLGLIHESIDVNRVKAYSRKHFVYLEILLNHSANEGDRILVCMGEFSLCSDDSRSGGQETTFVVWSGSFVVYHSIGCRCRAIPVHCSNLSFFTVPSRLLVSSWDCCVKRATLGSLLRSSKSPPPP